MLYYFFFFSSRRRHTRCSRDWSSDVCSSDLGLQAAHPRSRVGRRIVDRSFTFGTTIGVRVSVLSGLSDLVRRQLLGSELLRSRFRRGRLRGRWFLGGRWGCSRFSGRGRFRGRRDLADRPNLGLADLDPRHRMDRLASLNNRLCEGASDDAFHELADRLLRRDVGHELRHDRSYDPLFRRLNPAVRDRHRLHANVPAVLRHDVDRQVGPRPLPAGEPADVVRCHVVPDELRERVLALDLVHAELEFDVHLAEVAGEVLDRHLGHPADEFVRRVRGRLAQDLAIEHFRREEVVPHLRLPLVFDLAGGGAGLLLGHSGRSKGGGIFKDWWVWNEPKLRTGGRGARKGSGPTSDKKSSLLTTFTIILYAWQIVG